MAGVSSLLSQRGAAIILVLVCMLALSSLVISNQEQAFEGAVRARQLVEEYQADLLAESSLELVFAVLAKDETTNADTPDDPWAMPWSTDKVRVTISPCNARLNVAGLLDSNRTIDGFISLLPSSLDFAENLGCLQDWMDTDSNERVHGCEGSGYASMSPSYLPRNGLMKAPEELRMVGGWGELDNTWLRDNLTVWEDSTDTTEGVHPININFVSEEVFKAYVPEMASEWGVIDGWRESKGFNDISELRSASSTLASNDTLYNELVQELTVTSNTFRVIIEIAMPLVYEIRRYIVRRDSLHPSERPEVLKMDVLMLQSSRP